MSIGNDVDVAAQGLCRYLLTIRRLRLRAREGGAGVSLHGEQRTGKGSTGPVDGLSCWALGGRDHSAVEVR